MFDTFENVIFTLQIKQKRSTFGKKAKKGAMWKFTLDLTHPVEDGILDSANFVGFLVKALEFGNWDILLAFLIWLHFGILWN